MARRDLLVSSHAPAIDAEHTPDEFVLYLFPAPVKIEYDSPRALMTDFIRGVLGFTKSSGDKHVIGHAFVRLRSSSREILTGQTTISNTEEKAVVCKFHYGLGYFGTAFKGKLNSAVKLEGELQDRNRTGEMSYIRFLLSPETSARMMRYFESYCDHGYYRWWGEANRPRYGEGSACGSFGVSFLDVGGLLEDEYIRRWTVRFRIPVRFFGGPLFSNKVGLVSLLARNIFTSSWASEEEPHVPCMLWDPTMIHDWILNTWNRVHQGVPSKYKTDTIHQARGLVVDCHDVPTPTDSFFKDPITEPNIHGRQHGLKSKDDMREAMTRQLEAMVEAGLIDRDLLPT